MQHAWPLAACVDGSVIAAACRCALPDATDTGSGIVAGRTLAEDGCDAAADGVLDSVLMPPLGDAAPGIGDGEASAVDN